MSFSWPSRGTNPVVACLVGNLKAEDRAMEIIHLSNFSKSPTILFETRHNQHLTYLHVVLLLGFWNRASLVSLRCAPWV